METHYTDQSNSSPASNFYFFLYLTILFTGALLWYLKIPEESFEREVLLFFWLVFTSFGFPFLVSRHTFRLEKIIIIFLVALLSRYFLINSSSYYENDYHRYLVEGAAFAQGVDPYQTSVKEYSSTLLFNSQNLEFENRRDLYLHSLHTGYSWLPAIYPPLILKWFSLAKTPEALGWYTLTAEILLLALCCWLLPREKRFLLTLWLLHPLVLMEGYLNKHYDLLIGLLILLSLCAQSGKWKRISGVALGFSIHLKGFALIFLPFFPARTLRYGLFTLLLIELLSFAWFPTRFDAGSSMGVFVSIWEFNNGIFTGLRLVLENFTDSSSATRILRVIFSILLCCSWILVFKNRKSLSISPCVIVSVLFMLLSPVANPWYFLMSLPFFLIEPLKTRVWFLLAPCALYYLLFLSGDTLNALIVTTPATLLILFLALRQVDEKKI